MRPWWTRAGLKETDAVPEPPEPPEPVQSRSPRLWE